MKRVKAVAPASTRATELSAEFPELKAFPCWLRFMVETAYEDGTPRLPGKVWITNRGTAFEMMLFEPSAVARAPIVAKTLPDLWLAAELFLMSDESPWQEDDWLKERLARVKKKK